MKLVYKLLDLLAYFLTFSLLIFSPIPYGSVEPWARFVLQTQAFALFAIWLLISPFREGGNAELSVKKLLPFLLLLIICLFQLLPMPDFILGILSGECLTIWKESQSLLSSVGFEEEKRFFTISLYPHATWRETLILLSYAVFAFVISRKFKTERKIKILLIPIFALSLLEAAIGIYQYITKSTFVAVSNREWAVGTYVNRNHFAGFLEMTIPLALGYAHSLGDWHYGNGRYSFKKIISSDNFHKQLLILFMIAIMLLALIFSSSRMGIMSLFFSLVFFYLVSSRFRKKMKDRQETFASLSPKIIFFVLAVAVLYGLWIGFNQVSKRFAVTPGEASFARIAIWKDTLNGIMDFPILGTGLGTFEYVYPLYKKSVEEPVRFSYAHNDYLQLMLETGILGFLCAFTALSLFLLYSLRNLSRLYESGDYPMFFLALGALTGIVSILIHSLADFNLHIPANALYFAFLIGFSSAIGVGFKKDGALVSYSSNEEEADQ